MRVYLLERAELSGEPPALDGMEHLLTIDLAQIPELAARWPGKRALALFIGSRWENEAYTPHNGETRLVALDATSPTVKVTAREVPDGVFDPEDEEHEALRDQLYGAPGYALGRPIWLQGDEHDGEFILQFGEELVEMNLGDCGIMYVFEDTAFWQCS